MHHFLFTRAVFLRNTSYNEFNLHTVHQMPQSVFKLFIKEISVHKAQALIQTRCREISGMLGFVHKLFQNIYSIFPPSDTD